MIQTPPVTEVAAYLTKQMDEKLRKNILLRLWKGCIDAAKAIRFSSVAGVRNGVVIEAPITATSLCVIPVDRLAS